MIRMRVLHVTSTMNRGDIETNIMRVLRYYDRDQYQMDVCYG
jgi:hypothetical protein